MSLKEKFKQETGLDYRHASYIPWLEKYLEKLKKK
jgi:hypothetical protein